MRRATIESTVDQPGVVEAALAPDNTSDVDTRVDDSGEKVRTTIQRKTTASLEATVDDYVRNLDVAIEIVQCANQQTPDNT